MNIGSLERRQIERNVKMTITAALYEAKVKDDEIIRLLKKYCDIDNKEAINILSNEKFSNAPCRELEQYLHLEKGFDWHDADVFIHKYAKKALTQNPELSKLSPAKLYDTVRRR